MYKKYLAVVLGIMVALFIGSCSSFDGLTSELEGSYDGILPCADCPGIEMILVLKSKAKYESTMTYMDRRVTNKETGVWFVKRDKGEKGERIYIELDNSKAKTKTFFLLINNTTFELLDADKHPIDTGTGKKFRLKKY
jgi:uncharacterized lipoprotein NlpE involved in copper resistance